MTLFCRFRIIIFGIAQFLLGLIMISFPEYGTRVALFIIALYLIIIGYKNIFYYIFMSRFMVDGKLALIQGVILIDFGFLAGSLTDAKRIYIIIYLMILHAFSGCVEFLRALEEKKYGSKSWRLKLCHGIVNLVIVVLCIVFIQNNATTVIIFASGLIYSAIIRIISGFRKSSFLYV
jgi:uncharacterized membrane protein HdeD (DUF308 family)